MSRSMTNAQMKALLNGSTNSALGVHYSAIVQRDHVALFDADYECEWSEDWHRVGDMWYCTDAWSKYGIGEEDTTVAADEYVEPKLAEYEMTHTWQPNHGMLGWCQRGPAKRGGQKKRKTWGRDSIRKLSELED